MPETRSGHAITFAEPSFRGPLLKKKQALPRRETPTEPVRIGGRFQRRMTIRNLYIKENRARKKDFRET